MPDHWKEGGLPYRITKATERYILAETDAIVTLTQRIWPIIKDWEGLRGRAVHHEVIPCCVDLSLFKFSEEDRERRRAELKLGRSVYDGLQRFARWLVSDGKDGRLFCRRASAQP